jgi:hypothetical protein
MELKEKELKAKEAELRKLEADLRSTGALKPTKNWPKCYPITHHDIAGEVRSTSQDDAHQYIVTIVLLSKYTVVAMTLEWNDFWNFQVPNLRCVNDISLLIHLSQKFLSNFEMSRSPSSFCGGVIPTVCVLSRYLLENRPWSDPHTGAFLGCLSA